MNILSTIRREQGKLEKQAGKLQRQLERLATAAKALGSSAGKGADRGQESAVSGGTRVKISATAKRRWAKVRAGVTKR